MDESDSRKASMTYEEAAERVAAALRFGIEPSLDGIYALTAQLGDPQKRYTSIQVAGTNGKSSTARMLAALLHAEGYRVGLYTSPHLVEYPERFEIDGQVISHDDFARCITAAFRAADACGAQTGSASSASKEASGAHVDAIDHAGHVVSDGNGGGRVFTEFEILTAAAFELFAEAQVDYAVLEVGLGGRWDATSVVTPAVAAICGIGLDHTQILGDTLEKIAGEKAAIIKPGSIPVLGPGTAKVASVFLEVAARTGTIPRAVCAKKDSLLAATPEHPALFPTMPPELTCTFEVHSTSPHLRMDVSGCCGEYDDIVMDRPFYQAANAAVAICSAEAALGRALKPSAVQRALDRVVIPGRFETVRDDPLLIIDGAHNPEGALALRRAITDRFEGGKPPDPVARHSRGQGRHGDTRSPVRRRRQDRCHVDLGFPLDVARAARRPGLIGMRNPSRGVPDARGGRRGARRAWRGGRRGRFHHACRCDSGPVRL